MARRREGWGAGWWIVFFIVVAFIIWAVAWSWGGWGGYRNRAAVAPTTGADASTAATGQATAAPQVTVTDLTGQTQNGQYTNQNVSLNDVQVVARAGNQAFWVRGTSGDRLLVVENQNAMPQSDVANTNNEAATTNARKVRLGETVSILGKVERVSSGNQLQQQYGVQANAASKLREGEQYLVAEQIYPQVRNPNQNQNYNTGSQEQNQPNERRNR